MLFLFSVSYPVTISVWETPANNWAIQLIKINHTPLCKPIWPIRSKEWLICKSTIANLDYISSKENPYEMIAEMLWRKWFSGLSMVISTVRQGFVNNFFTGAQWYFSVSLSAGYITSRQWQVTSLNEWVTTPLIYRLNHKKNTDSLTWWIKVLY